MSNYERIPLKKGDELDLVLKDARGETYSQKAVIEEYIGKGATCLTYTVALYKDSTNSARMIMKEFYPKANQKIDGLNIERDGKKLNISVRDSAIVHYVQERKRFYNSYEMQNRLSGSDAMEIMVKPYQIAEYGDSQYLLSDIHKGTVLSASEIKDFSQKIWLIYRMAEAIQLLHEQGYLYMDLNPKNVLWIESQQIVKLFDVDSIVPYKNLEDVHEIRVTRPYVAPEIDELEDWFEINKKTFLKPSWDVYCLGLLLFELIFERFPTEKDLETGVGKEGELEAICSRNEYDEKTCALLKEILKRSLSKKFRIRYRTAQEMCEAVNELKKRVDARAFISKKEFVKANAMMKAYYMLDRWPLYKFLNNDSEKQVMDIAVIGNHSVREEFVKAVYSCTHMLEGTTRIRLYSPDAKEFWDSMEEKNPLLGKTIRLFLNGKCIRSEQDCSVCSKPIAEIYLYEKKDISKLESNYILLLEEKRECPNSIKRIQERFKNSNSKLIAYLDDGTNYINQVDYLNHTIVPISMVDKCSYYDEKLLETELLQRALNVHTLYYRNNHKRASWEEMKEDFESNIYFMESSMRSALTVKYKLYSIGLNPEEKHIADQFYEKVLSDTPEAKELFAKLSSLEHLSWSSFLIINGWNLPTVEQIEEYAFVGKNDFKDKERNLHPCLVECRPGRGLENWSHEDWETPIDENLKVAELDRLDQMSVILHQIAKKKSQKAVKKIHNLMDTLGELVQKYHFTELKNAYQWLSQVKQRIFAGEVTADSLWRQAEYNFGQTLKKLGIVNPQLQEMISGISQELRVVKEYHSFHEYKKSDGAIIYGIPYILTGDKVKCVIKPYIADEKNRWKNILVSLYLEPEEMVFVPKQSIYDKNELNGYREFFEKRGIKTRILVKDFEEIEKDRYHTVWDVTGLSEEKIEELKKKENMDHVTFISLSEGEIVGLSNYIKGQFARNTHLEVEEIFDLFGEELSANGREQIAQLLGGCYQNIWKAYQTIGPEIWKSIAEILSRIEKQNMYELPSDDFSVKMQKNSYVTDPVNGKALQLAEVHKILRKCKEEGLIGEYFYPGEEDELSVYINDVSEEVFYLLQKLILKANEEPLKHKYRFEIGTDGKYRIYDQHLYVTSSDLAEHMGVLRILEKYGKDSHKKQVLLQNLRLEDGVVKFKYATEAVRQSLQDENAVLDIQLYYVCQSLGRFDDIDIGTDGVLWCSENAKMNSVSLKIVCTEESCILEIACTTDCFELFGKTKKAVYHYPVQTKPEEIQKDIYEFFEHGQED